MNPTQKKIIAKFLRSAIVFAHWMEGVLIRDGAPLDKLAQLRRDIQEMEYELEEFERE